ncbi:sulfatase-like hydrolase/transferase [Mariniflexile gromovii]|uniref:Sulfatase-like hydrolase/transferase n=1 Tax=Mariniflexile gromovii TaxID=362523 RepID=A0ABS4BSU0_9FLAO|nr:sulfatase-like hydrolase/transferase [Mariniflexile gromovii]MBP0903653.1 sulfatase-like hydrolase/transferase [Mariniflexile gromovii]
MLKKIKPFLVFLLPLFLKYIFLFITVGYKLLNYEDVFEDLIFCIIVYIALNTNVFKKQFYKNCILALYVFYFALEGASYMAVSSNFTSSFMYVLIESSKGELKEFVHSYNNMGIVVFIALMVVSFFLLKRNQEERKSAKVFLIGLTIILALTILLKFTGLIESNAYHNIVRGAYGYYDLQRDFKLNASIKKEDIELKNHNDVLVVVLGESTTSHHMGLYGYYRQNTPNLTAFKDSLFVYNNVISSDVFTLKAVPKMLTSLSNDSNIHDKTNIISIFSLAGYKTYWLSNQRPISYHDNAISKIAATADFFKFYNHKIDKNTSVLDEILLPKYDEILKEPGKKVIFIRLIGTHFDYFKRYPSTFNKYDIKTDSEKKKVKNQYDNAVLYNDFIVYSILKSLKKEQGKNALVYISDHGENVYDDGDFIGRNESNLKKNMFDIPFIVWTSKDFELPTDFEYVPNRKFMADHLYESLGHLFGVKYKNMDFSKSIFSNTFKERKRIVVTGKDYDTYFTTKHE